MKMQTSPSPQNEKARSTRQTILSTALKIASREGIEGLTIGELAKAVGMSKSGLFAHFGGREHLQLEVLRLATEDFVDAVLRPAFTHPRGAPRIHALLLHWRSHLNDASRLPGGSILIAASIELDDRPGALRNFAQRAQKDLISNIEKAARIAIEEGHFRKNLDVEQFAWSLYSFVLGYHHFKRMLDDPKAELHLSQAFANLMALAQSPSTQKLKPAQSQQRDLEKSKLKLANGPGSRLTHGPQLKPKNKTETDREGRRKAQITNKLKKQINKKKDFKKVR